MVLLDRCLVGDLVNEHLFTIVYLSTTLSSDSAISFLVMLATGCSSNPVSHTALLLLSGRDQVNCECCLRAGRLATPFGFSSRFDSVDCTMERDLWHSSIAFIRNKTRLAAFALL